MTEFEREIRDLLIESLELDVNPDDFQANTPLFDGENGLGLDSLEALEIVTCLSAKYGTQFSEETPKEVFTSVETLAKFVDESRVISN
jgi:acyl carrier protein